jgi:hypothetical protein
VRKEFFEHYGARWQSQNVKRFILFVTGDLSSTQHQNMILKENCFRTSALRGSANRRVAYMSREDRKAVESL